MSQERYFALGGNLLSAYAASKVKIMENRHLLRNS